jgi:acyl-CoA thioesterase FadM
MKVDGGGRVENARPWSWTARLRFADLDYLGHVTAAAYLVQFEEARARWLADLWRTPRPAYVLVRQEIDYLREVQLEDDPIAITVRPIELRTSSFDIEEELIAAAGDVRARSRATLVNWDVAERRSRPLDDRQRAALLHEDDPGSP